MKHKFATFILSFIFSSYFSSASAKTFDEYIADVLENLTVIKVAKANINAEKHRQVSADYYFSPVITSVAQYSSDKTNVDDSDEKSEVTLTGRVKLYSSDVLHKKDETNFKVSSAYNNLHIQEESVIVNVTKNMISIRYYENLRDLGLKLKKSASELLMEIENQYKNGTASKNDVTRTQLLVNKIDNEISSSDEQISLLKSNIELATEQPYPENGVEIESSYIEFVQNYEPVINDLTNNLSYLSLMIQSDISESVARQQDPLISVNITGESAFKEENDWQNESEINLSLQLNLFSLTKKQEEKALLESSIASDLQVELKLSELKNNLKTLNLLEASHAKELGNLNEQIQQTQFVISTHNDEYLIGKVSLYEMLNTRLDLFMLNKQKTEVEIENFQNKIDMLQLTGGIR